MLTVYKSYTPLAAKVDDGFKKINERLDKVDSKVDSWIKWGVRFGFVLAATGVGAVRDYEFCLVFHSTNLLVDVRIQKPYGHKDGPTQKPYGHKDGPVTGPHFEIYKRVRVKLKTISRRKHSEGSKERSYVCYGSGECIQD